MTSDKHLTTRFINYLLKLKKLDNSEPSTSSSKLGYGLPSSRSSRGNNQVGTCLSHTAQFITLIRSTDDNISDIFSERNVGGSLSYFTRPFPLRRYRRAQRMTFEPVEEKLTWWAKGNRPIE